MVSVPLHDSREESIVPRPSLELPPRPNPGPELPAPPTGWGWGLGLTLLVLGLATGIAARRLQRFRSAPEPKRDGPGVDSTATAYPSAFASELQVAEEARRLLVERFGPCWAALTTEEIGSRPELRTCLDDEQISQLLSLFERADRIKFGTQYPSEIEASELAQRDWSGWLESLRGGSPAGARDTSTGR